MRNINVASIGSELLRSFYAVAQAGNITQASFTLGRSQSAISLQIAKLEDILGVRLFERRSRGVLLTKDGKSLFPVAEKAIEAIDQVAALFSQSLPAKRIRLGLPDDYNETILKKALDRFASRIEDAEVIVSSGCTAQFPEAIRRNELDLAVHSAGPLERESVFFSEATLWAASKSFSLPDAAPVPLAFLDRDCWWRDVATKALDEAGLSWRTAYVSENFDSIKSAIASGLAVGILAKSAVANSMRTLGAQEGFPALPPTSLRFLKNDKAPADLLMEMEEAIRLSLPT